MADRLINPQVIGAIAVLMIAEALLLVWFFRRRKDRARLLISVGNTVAGVSLMGAVAAEMTSQPPALTGLCLLAALAGHVLEVRLRLR